MPKPKHPKKSAGASAGGAYDADRLRDSISMNMQDDCLDVTHPLMILPFRVHVPTQQPPVPPPRATGDLSPPINANQPAPSSPKNSHQFFILFRP
ncbi:hypothetical protein PCANC_00373 [Puccinia coronata f. sp. avenae]|uniref:Uncharacterized protein n=1 Tax=Puccinia coronata f. sp. avenae TaxID=200324 RepID=A0A2N5W9J9_9BASI|nr:hypothetical protein PCANC_00373 [Puccinia coronata f. sp. avenae]